MQVNRGGNTLTTGKIGQVKVLRQQMMMPGEMIDAKIQGSVRLETLRERDVMRINAHLGVFMTPLRWVWSDFPQYLKEGPDTAVTPPVITNETNWEKYGVGSYKQTGAGSLYQFYKDSVLRVYNEWYKHPEDNDATTWPRHGKQAVPLSAPWSRCRYSATPDDTADYQIDVSGSTMDVRELAEVNARFRGAMKRDITSFKRWMELVKDTYSNSDPSREVDQVPIMIEQVDLGLHPREMPATDGASLGQFQSMFDFGVDHRVGRIVAPEHCIITYMLTIRFAPIIESCHPLATNRLDWFELVGDPEYISAAQPVEVQIRDYEQSTDATVMGFLAAGWQWRCASDCIGQSIDVRNSFPYSLAPTTQAEGKDASRVKNAFRSQALDDYMVDLYFTERSHQPIGSARDSYFSGMLDETIGIGQNNDEFPFGGKQL